MTEEGFEATGRSMRQLDVEEACGRAGHPGHHQDGSEVTCGCGRIRQPAYSAATVIMAAAAAEVRRAEMTNVDRRAIALDMTQRVDSWADLDVSSRTALLSQLRARLDLQLAETKCVPIFPAAISIRPLGKGAVELVVEQRCLPPQRFADWPADHPLPRMCRICGCDEIDCSGCVARTGQICSWVAEDLCSACV